MTASKNYLAEYISQHASIIHLVLTEEGLIKQANNFASKIAGKELAATHISDFFTGFNAGLDMQALMEGSLRKSMLNINTAANIPESLYFTSFRKGNEILLIGEFDHGEVEKLRSSMLGLNNELNNLARELHKKNAQLEQLNRLKNDFIGMAAHDLRNPISSIYSFTDFMLESDGVLDPSDLLMILETIKRSSEFMLNLLNELLDVVKIESGKLELNMSLTNLDQLLYKNIELNSVIASKKDIALLCNIPQKLPLISLDALKIEQVLNNLISNAIKYSHSNTKVSVSAFATEKSIVVTVQDQGQGIPKEELDKLFIPFSKISVKGTAGEKSIGLGLSIVKRIITGHKGRLWVESEVGRGTSFHFSLPFESIAIQQN